MKIIATTDRGFLVALTKKELSLIVAQEDPSKQDNIFQIGFEMSVTRINERADKLKNLDTKRLKVIKTSLQEAIDVINRAENDIAGLKLFDTIKEYGDAD